MKIPVAQAVAIGALILVVLGGVVAFVLSGRSTTSPTSTAAVSGITTTANGTSSAVTTDDVPPQVMTSLENAAGIPPKPDTATADAYIAALVAIDPDIVHGKPDMAISRGRDQCSSVREHPNDRARLVTSTQMRFSSPKHPSRPDLQDPRGFGPEKAGQILDAVRKYLCPAF